MMFKRLKILCLETGSDITKFVQTVYGSIPHKIIVREPTSDIFELLKDDVYQLLIVENKSKLVDVNLINKIVITNPKLYIIILDEDYNSTEDYGYLKRINLLTQHEISSKLPIILGDIYSDLTRNSSEGFDFWTLIWQGLDRIDGLVIIANDNSQIIFTNKTGKKLLDLTDDSSDCALIDFLVDGEKVWKYLLERCIGQNDTVDHYAVRFLAANGQEFEKQIRVSRMDSTEDCLMVQSAERIKKEDIDREGQYQLLDKFADSVANELLNPVNVISGRLQLLQADLNGAEQYSKSMLVLEKQVQRINDTIAKLLTFARLKQDSVPQKIQINEVLQRLILVPSIKRLIDGNEGILEFKLQEGLPVLSGLLSHFDLLFNTLLESGLLCLAKEGNIKIETSLVKNYLKQNWLKVTIKLNHVQPCFGRENTWHAYFNKSGTEGSSRSIEVTIIEQIIKQYHGSIKITRENQNIEALSLLFPEFKSI